MAGSISIPNHHKGSPEKIDLSPDRYISLFENKHGEQMIFSGDRSARSADLGHGDMDWQVYHLTRDEMYPPLQLQDDEQAWLVACWASLLRKHVDDVAQMVKASRAVPA